ncbi:MAG: 30S ribosomal protein S2 [Anaerolineales bacterium]|jgi:small subunit ribosomal protein S2
MAVVSMKALLESGVHFGHRTHKWHPKMKPYIFTERNSIHIIDLQQTVKALEVGYDLVRDIVAEGGTVLFVGTKRQAQETVHDEAVRAGMPYVTNRWLGGMLTNWRTIRQRVNELEQLERMRDKGDFERITKREALTLTRRIERLEYLLGGIRNMTQLPNLVFIVDVRKEETTVHEANLLEIPILAMVDTNCDPRDIDYVIPSNDDAIRAIKLVVGRVADAVVEGHAMRKDLEEEEAVLRTEAAMEGIEEMELTDEELLGEATLAKISASQEAALQEAEAKAQAEAEEAAKLEESPETEAEAVADEEPEEAEAEVTDEAEEEQPSEETRTEDESEEEAEPPAVDTSESDEA